MPRQDAQLAATGALLFEVNGCSICHGNFGAAVGAVPNLNRMPPTESLLKVVVQQGALARNGMPQFKDVSDADLKALYAYIVNQAWQQYDKDRMPTNSN
jgi:quinohemoprotein ethanol dehydrogenase